MRYTNRWQPLDFVGSLEECVREIRRDSWGVFFGPPGPPALEAAPPETHS
jgi:hypothetical protein